MIPSALNIDIFAEYIETIKMLYRVDEDFKILCDDYATSRMNIEKSIRLSLKDRASELDYKQLSLELEKEIIDYVQGLRGSDQGGFLRFTTFGGFGADNISFALLFQ